MVVGLGVDITEVDRIQAAIDRHGRAFLRRIFTPSEIAYCEKHRNHAERFAGRFAAKEAAMKALGTGWRHGVRWVDIEVVREPSGKPTLKLSGATREIAEPPRREKHRPYHHAQRKHRPRAGHLRSVSGQCFWNSSRSLALSF